MKNSSRIILGLFPLFFALFFFECGSVWALPWQQVPDPRVERSSFVQDSAGMLGADAARVDGICQALERKTGVELAVVTVDSLEGLTVEEYAVQLFRRLGIGKKGKDNGVLILFSLQDRKVRLEVGYGLEGTLTDARSSQLLDEYAIPRFKNRQYAQGLFDLTAATAEELGGDRVEKGPPPSRLSAEEAARIDREIELIKQRERESRDTRIRGLVVENLPRALTFLAGLITATLGLGLILALMQRFSKARAAKLEKLRKLKGVMVILTIVFFIALPFSIVFGVIRWVYPVFLGFPLLGIALIPTYIILKRRALAYRLACPQCNAKMEIVPEYQDDRWLSNEEVDEEKARGMDYEFWSCPQCSTLQRFNVKLGGASACPQCGRRSLVETSKVLKAATTSSSGLRLRQEDCKNRRCDYFKEWQEIIPRRSSSSSVGGGFSSSSSGSSSFGGGRSGGGGASGSW